MKSKKRVAFIILMLVAVHLLVAPVMFAKTTEQTKCPVRGNTVNSNVYTDYEGKRIYFCCPPCIRSFLNDPQKYLKQMEKAGVIPEDAPKSKTSEKGR